MAGIYIHIPFCRQKCYYCDFYKTVNTSLIERFISALKTEVILRKNYMDYETIKTIYFGGGTPSVLTIKHLDEILQSLKKEFRIDSTVEITVEANPDDLSESYLKNIYDLGIKRLSIGIQSFQNLLLEKMNRRHNEIQAVEAVLNAAKTGFQNISVDLIYGLPGLTNENWKSDLDKTFQLPVQHLSAYHLTYHEGTPFYTWLKKGTLKELDEPESLRQFETLMEVSQKNGFEQYEISNFARSQLYSKHNTSYWLGISYVGLGPSAHSFNGISRRWNVSHTEGYISSIEKGVNFYDEEQLTENEKYNEFILTRIRTVWGVSINELKKEHGKEKVSYFLKNIEKYLKSSLVVQENGVYKLTRKGLFVSDEIMSNLMYI